MIAVVLLLILLVWAAVLVPPWIRARAEHSPISSIAGFSRRLSLLGARSLGERPLPGFSSPIPRIPPPSLPPPRERPMRVSLGGIRQTESQWRRTLVLEALLIAGGCTLLLGLLPALRFFLVIFVLDLVAMVGYLVLLLQWKRDVVERHQKVRPLSARPLRTVPSFEALQRQAR
jgi:hypothetical protein